ncbi:Murein DD-endopeptidase MepH [Micromonospora sp. MH33]|uniref:C40 family peptidase n=1 Tax=Micromonospora sp. MH33 TaxID=1945509 RepID=UPI000D2A02A1|nr:NlpC/P60 family protein [Micromonospora sp. MH33]PSK65573.1 Murein DD-endopeptidase MepH [Micromonospora sp. MH33]
MGRVAVWVTAGAAGSLLLLTAATAGVVSSAFGGGAGTCVGAVTAPGATPAGLSAEQARNAGAIVTVGERLRVPVRGWVIAIAAALQESSLINHGDLGPTNDHDSLGLFQQRPSQGWGTPEQIMDPGYAAGKFYERLLTVPGWERLPLTEAAQKVQRSAYPDAYAQHEARAAAIVASYTGGVVCDDGDGLPPDVAESLPPGFAFPAGTPPPVVTAIGWALAQLGTPYTYGGDCTDPHSGIPRRQCDCSSLMQQAYRAAGVTIGRTTRDQVHDGAPVPGVAELRPGDLILIAGSDGTRSDPRHVGMFIGAGLIVQAPKTGDVVRTSKLSRWVGQVAAVRRIVPS